MRSATTRASRLYERQNNFSSYKLIIQQIKPEILS